MAIAKKHCRLATGRSRIKRIVRESFRRHAAELDSVDIVVMNTPGTTEADNDRLRDSLARHWQQCRTASAE